MRNALEVLAEMQSWWDSASPLPRTPQNAIDVGITWLYNRTYGDYQVMELESSKIAHFRALFTVWKAVCARMENNKGPSGYPFYMPSSEAVKAFPLYLEKKMPDLFPTLLANRVFLGVQFNAEDLRRHEELKREFTRQAPLQPAQKRAMTAMLNRRISR